MKILFLGDVVGKVGRRAVRCVLPRLIYREEPALVVANCENVAGGVGVDPKSVRELISAGVDVLTSGNHIWREKAIAEFIGDEPRLLRPANYPDGAPGRGWGSFATASGVEVGVVNLLGRVFMHSLDCPFRAMEEILPRLRERASVILVDMHSEATSEKGAMGWFLDGQVAAVLGTHTHVQTADERLLPGGTAFLSDAGMCGPLNSIIGVKPDLVIRRFRTQMPVRFEPAGGAAVVQGAVVTVDRESGRATAIKRIAEEFSGQ